MPWLAGTALIHSLAVTEKRGVFKSWTVLLAIFTFCLSLLGTFLVRSGVLTSVHAFAADPTRGVFILVLLFLMVGGSLLLYALKASEVKSKVTFGATGREAWLLLNNILLTTMTLTVLLGTLYPLIVDALGFGKISVGAPYFNSVFSPMALLLMVFMAIGPLSKWHNTPFSALLKKLLFPAAISLISSAILVYFYDLGVMSWISLSVAVWVLVLTFYDWFIKVSAGSKGIIPRAKTLPRNYYGMVLAHLGMAVSLVGVLFVSVSSDEQMVRMAKGDVSLLSGYEFKFEGELEALGESINITIYRIVQEALNNICSHANATRALVILRRKSKGDVAAKSLFLSVEDNGKGYDSGKKSKGFGLLGMRERTIAAGGKFTIRNVPNGGTQICVNLPLVHSNKKRRADDI